MEYLIKRELKSLNRMGMKVIGPVDQNGTPQADSSQVGLEFNRSDATVAKANLLSGKHYLADILIFGDPEGKLTISAAIDSVTPQFEELFQISVPAVPTVPITSYGYAKKGQVIFTAPEVMS